MKMIALGTALVAMSASGTGIPTARWSFDTIPVDGMIRHGALSTHAGTAGNSVVFGGQSCLEVKDSANLAEGRDGFTLLIWVNPYAANQGQQMIAAKNCYSLNERQWGVMIDKDGCFHLYLWQGHWVTVDSKTHPEPGHWHLVGIVIKCNEAELWINGVCAGHVPLENPIAGTEAPVTFGAVNDNDRIRQGFVGALDESVLFDHPLSQEEMSAMYKPVSATHDIPKLPKRMDIASDAYWQRQAGIDAKWDRTAVVFDGKTPNKLACDTTLREMPDGTWVMIMLGGGDTEPLPQNRVFITRSMDEGQTWGPMEPIDLGIRMSGPITALVPSELMVHNGRCTLFVATHDGTFADWKEWMTSSDDSCRTWSPLQPAPGKLRDRTFIRNHIVTRDGRILLPFQHYTRVAETREINGGRKLSPPTDPRNGVLMSADNGKTWTIHGDIRISLDNDYHGWAENNIVELNDGRIAMLIRADRLGGTLFYAESADGGRTWPQQAFPTAIPNPGSKATLYSPGGDTVALLHNPNPNHRSPLALWVSFDGMKSWPYQRILVPESCDGPRGCLNYPDGFVSTDRKWLYFAFDDNRHRGICVAAKLPFPVPRHPLWNGKSDVPTVAELPVLTGVDFRVIKPYEFEKDGYRFLHGVALASHHGRLYASFGHNRGGENTDTEEARGRVSDDGGKTWSETFTIDSGEPGVGVSHGVFLSHQGCLWAFHGAYRGIMEGVHTRAYRFNEEDGTWEKKGTVLEGGFWPMQEPLKMADGNWIMAGLRVGDGNPAAVAISHGENLLQWDLVVIPKAPGAMWGESSIIVSGKRIIDIARYHADSETVALVACSDDYGRTWTPSEPSDLPMAASKPYTGTLSTGHNYLICTTSADSGNRRSPLTIAVSRPNELQFSRIFVIRHAEFDGGPGESHPGANLAYPYAIEHGGKLYVGYSNSGGNVGRVGKGRELWNNNSAELAIIPLDALTAE